MAQSTLYCAKNVNTPYERARTHKHTHKELYDYILITNFMHQLLFIHKVIFSSTRFEPQVLIFRRIQLYTCSIWYRHSLWEFMVACRYTQYSPLHVSSLKCSSSGGYSCTHAAYGTVTLYKRSWWPVGTQLECTDRPPRSLVESDSAICCMYTIVSSWRWALEARNM